MCINRRDFVADIKKKRSIIDKDPSAATARRYNIENNTQEQFYILLNRQSFSKQILVI